MSTDAQLRANRANSQLSHGPVSDLGKSISSRNALKHGLTGATVVLPTDKIEEYDKLVAMIFNKFNPETDPERHVIQTVADTEWRLLRFPFLESAAYAKGSMDAERPIHELGTEDAHVYREAEAQQAIMKQLANLSLLESRLQRKLKLATSEFEKLRHEREIIQTAYRDEVMHSMLVNPITLQPNEPKPHKSVGIEFSFPYLVARITFKKFAPKEDIAVFDRTWPDKSAKTNN